MTTHAFVFVVLPTELSWMFSVYKTLRQSLEPLHYQRIANARCFNTLLDEALEHRYETVNR